jgi:hypothetical protein
MPPTIETSGHPAPPRTLSTEVARRIRLVRPRSVWELRGFIESVLGFRMPARPVVRGHDSPLAYLEHAFFEDRLPRDAVVWAPRGGGKTQLGAIATLLDLLFKPGIQVRILAGSFEQASKMHRYLRRMLDSEVFADLVAGRLTGRHVELVNGSRVEVLSQSEASVRGQRVHKLRCDEVELFEPPLWEAAQLITRSGACGDTLVRGSIEALSTMHRPFGLMKQLVSEASATRPDEPPGTPAPHETGSLRGPGLGPLPGVRRVFRWSVLDVLERCPDARPCATCPLWPDCGGLAKSARGFLTIDDAIQQRRRVGEHVWRAEMLCLEPARGDSVYPEFDAATHVRSFTPEADGRMLRVDGAGEAARRVERWVGGIDFGIRSPTALLWGCLDERGELFIVDEFLMHNRVTEAVAMAAAAHGAACGWPRPAWLGADPAGNGVNEQTGRSTIAVWKSAGWPIRSRGSAVQEGIAAVRSRLRTADGGSRLFIHPRCRHLVQAMIEYHYPTHRPQSLEPVKDGHDHIADALRYLVLNLDASFEVHTRRYMPG